MVPFISLSPVQENGIAGQKRKASGTLTAERRKITRACDSCKVYPPRTNSFASEDGYIFLSKVLIILTLDAGKRQDAPEHYHVIVVPSCREPANTTRLIREELRRLRCPLRALRIAKMLYDVLHPLFGRPYIGILRLRDRHLRPRVQRDPSCVEIRNHSPSCRREVALPNQKPRTWRVII